jgi:signal transduction histidine kinase
MLDLNRIDESQLLLNQKTFSLNNLIDETVQDFKISSPSTEIFVEHNCECNVYADKDRIAQVLINFITNAVKYSPEDNRVEINVYYTDGFQVAVSVKDYGIGIDKVNYKNIFKRFYRVSGKNEETYAGFGIGLFLAKDIIERHNGTIIVKSKKGEGSSFIFTLNTITD